jgi:hypothetical protein
LINIKDGKPFSSSLFGKRLNALYGDNVGVDVLRSVYLTDKFGDVSEKLEEMNKVTKQMGSSSNSALQYYIKNDVE